MNAEKESVNEDCIPYCNSHDLDCIVAGVAWHDGKVGVTPLISINNLSVPEGTVVRVRGTITGMISGISISVNDGTGTVNVPWADTASLTVYSLVVIRAAVNSAHTLRDTVFVEPVWLFA